MLIHSQEPVTPEIIPLLYRVVLGREPDPDGLRAHAANARAAKLTVRDLAASFMASEEYKRRLNDIELRGKWIGIAEARREIAHALELRQKSEADFVNHLRSFWVRLPQPPADPWSRGYRQHWLDVYGTLSGGAYDTSREGHDFDVAGLTLNPSPYCTESYEIVGNQLIGVGSIIKAMQLPPKSSVLELGPGWGNTTLAMAQMGYRVTAIDIEKRYVDLLRARAKILGVSVNVVLGDFFAIRDLSEKFDAVLFYEAFHHCHDHLALLDAIPRVLKPGGKLALAGETVMEGAPYDWGLNPSGEAIYQITDKGWFELTFRESYLYETLHRKGWTTKKIDAPIATGVVYLSQR